MKKLLSFVIVAMMIVSLVVPAFAINEPPEASGVENTFDVYLSTTIDLEDTAASEYELPDDKVTDETTEFVVYANLANNFDGFEYLKFFVIYPECLTLEMMDIIYDDEGGILSDGDLTESTEHTEPDGLFIRALYTLYGYDVGDGDPENMTPEQLATYEARTEELLGGGRKWTSPLIDAERSARIKNPDTGRTVKTAVDFAEEEGPLVYFLFSYDPELNPNKEDLKIDAYSDPEGGLHASLEDWNDPNGWGDEWAFYNAYGITIPVEGDVPPVPHEHNYVETARVEATCAADGYIEYTCQGEGECDTPTYRETIPATGAHTAGEAVEENRVEPADCTTPGSYDLVTYCTVCGAELSREAQVIAAPGHVAGEPVEENRVEPVDCQTPGSYDEVVYCTVCGAEISRETKTIDPLPHDGKAKLTVEPTADAAGEYVVKCKVCGEILETVEVPALSNPFEIVLNNVTTTPGETVTIPVSFKNTQYGISDVQFDFYYDPAITDVSIALGEFYEGQEFHCKDESTAERGLKHMTIYTETTDELLGDGNVVYITFTAPAEEGTYNMGILTFDDFCANYKVNGKYAGQINYDVPADIPATLTVQEEVCDHVAGDPVEENRVEPADCVTDGSYDLVTYCTICGEELSRETITIAAPGHQPAEAVLENVVEASCTVGYYAESVVYCSVCGAELSRNVISEEAPGHQPADAVEENRVEPADCVTDGSYDLVVYCSVCGAELSREAQVIAAPGHQPAEAVLENVVEASCTVGYYAESVVYCSVCGTELSRNVISEEAPGHDYVAVVTDPTCTEAGYTTYTCSVCGDTYTADEVAALGHDYGKPVFVAPTADADGSVTRTCTRCGDEVVTVLDAFTQAFALVVDDQRVTEGDAVTVPVEVKNTQYGVSDVQFDVYYDEALGEVEFALGDFYGDGAEIYVSDSAVAMDGKTVKHITIYTDGTDEILGDGALVNATFTAPEAGDYAIGVLNTYDDFTAAYFEDGKLIGFIDYSPADDDAVITVEEAICEHVAGDPVEENRVEPADCVTDGSYDLVTYCTICGEELSRETITIPAPGHQPADAVEENRVEPADCVTDGSYDLVVYCSVCGAELSREAQVIAAPGHVPADAVDENVVPATCTEAGHKDVVVYCSVCGAELSRETVETDAALGHIPGEWVVEGDVENQYCTRCGELINTRPYEEPVDEPIDLSIVPGSRVASAEIDNDARVINVVSKKDQKYISYSFKLDGKDIKTELTLDDAAFTAGNTLMIKSVEYNADTEAAGIRYVKSYAAGGFEQTYEIIFTVDGKDYTYTVNVTFDHSPAASGVEPGFTANADLTGFVEGDDHTIQVVAQEGADWVAFRLLLAKGATVSVKSGNVHTFQSPDKGATYVDNGTNVDPSVYAYFRTYKAEVENYEYDLTVTYENGDSEDFHVVVSFPE